MSVLQLSLSAFEGPLDLLYHLVLKAKIDIREIFIYEITEQFLASIEDLSLLNADRASAFLDMASLLVEIKSRAMLPKAEVLPAEDPEELLYARLEEYKKIKEASYSLRKKEETALLQLYKLPQEHVFPDRFVLREIPITALKKAFLELMENSPLEEEEKRAIPVESFTRKEATKRILDVLKEKERVLFTDLFLDCPGKMDRITLFLTLLELFAASLFTLEQDGVFAPIYLRRCAKMRG